MPPPERYNAGYNVGVGGAVVKDGRLLLVPDVEALVGTGGPDQAATTAQPLEGS